MAELLIFGWVGEQGIDNQKIAEHVERGGGRVREGGGGVERLTIANQR